MSIKMEQFKQGADLVGKAAAEKFDQISSTMNDLKSAQENIAAIQEDINETIKSHVDRQGDEIRALKDNRHYIKASRHSLDDMDLEEQQLVFSWLEKLLHEMAARSFNISPDQQAFLLNFRKYIGMLDESFQIEHLSVLEKMGEGGTHQVIYKIFLALVYLHNASLDPLSSLSDIDGMFKLSLQTKTDEQDLLKVRAQTLGLEGLVAMYDQERPISSFTVANVFSQHIELGSHPVLSWNIQKNQLEDYVRSFALLAIDAPENDSEQLFSFVDKQKEFLSALSKQFGCRTVLFELNDLCKNPRNVNVDTLKSILSDKKKKYTFLLDIIALASFRDSFNNNAALFSSISRVINLDDPKLSEFIEAVKILARATEQQEIVKSILSPIASKTDGWEHILSFRGITFKGAFSSIREKLDNLSNSIWRIKDELRHEEMECVGLLIESPLVQKMKRGKHFQRLNEIKNNASLLVLGDGDRLYAEAIRNISAFIDVSCYIPKITKLKIDMEELREMQFTPSSGEDWDTDFEKGVNKTDKGLDTLSDLVDRLIEQLELIEDGHFRESVDAKRCKLAEAKKRLEDEERATKASVVLDQGERQVRVSVSWTDWDEDLPFDPSDLQHAATDEKKWLAATSSEVYACVDGERWDLVVQSDYSVKNVKYINNIWVVESRDAVFVSSDTQQWEAIALPDSSSYSPNPCLYFDGSHWILRLNQDATYTYEEKGFIWSSTETDTYQRPVFYRSADFKANWEKWEGASDLPRSGFVPCSDLVTCNKTSVAAFAYDMIYQDKKNIDETEFSLMYLKGKKSWQSADLPQSKSLLGRQFTRSAVVWAWKERFYMELQGDLYISEKGFAWETTKIPSSGRWGEGRDMLMLFPDGGDQLMLSTDAHHFSELKLDEGQWTVIAGMNESLLAKWQKDHHEVILKKGTIHYKEI
jgi:hypothetical protein